MAAPTCLYTDPKKAGDGPRLYLSNLHGWVEDTDQALEFFSLSTAPRVHQVPIGYLPSQPILAEVVKVHPASRKMRTLVVPKLQELFPQAHVSLVPPRVSFHHPWFIAVAMPDDKRSFVIEYRHHHGYHLKAFGQVGAKEKDVQDFIRNDDEMMLQAITISEPIACPCWCHGPSHCCSIDSCYCCPEIGTPRTNADWNAHVP